MKDTTLLISIAFVIDS